MNNSFNLYSLFTPISRIFRHRNFFKEFTALLCNLALLLNSFLPYYAAIPAYAEEATPTQTPVVEEIVTPTVEPTVIPTIEPTAEPTIEPTAKPTIEPTVEPTLEPTAVPTVEPTPEPTSTSQNDSSSNSSSDTSTPTSIPTPTIVVTPTTAPGISGNQTPKGQIDTTVILNNSCRTDLLNPNLSTDKADYSPTEIAIIKGTGFSPSTEYSLVITSNDLHNVYQIVSDSLGNFTYSYQLDGTYRPNYQVEAITLSGIILATTTFLDHNDPAPALTASWSDCTYECSSNDVTIQKMELVTASGSQISCNPGQTVTAYIKVIYDNHSTTRHAVYLKGDIYQNNVFVQSIDSQSSCVNDLTTTDNYKIMSTGFTWDCGSSISIKNLIISWGNHSSTCNDIFTNGNCNPPGHSYCNNGLDYIVVTPLVANFSTNNVCLGDTTTFTDQTTGGTPSYSYNWIFGDGTTSIVSSPTHTYTSAQTYSVTQNVSDSTVPPKTDSETKTVTVYPKPTVDFSASASSCPLMTVNFDNTSSIGTYLWTFGDGTTSTATDPSHSYSSPGDYQVTLKTTNTNNCFDQKSQTITINPCIGTLIVKKLVTNDNGGEKMPSNFTLSLGNTSFEGSESGTSFDLIAGTYSVGETQLSGYSQIDNTCVNVTLSAGETKNCTITNDDIAPHLKLVKSLVHNYNDPFSVSDWTLSAVGSTLSFSGKGTVEQDVQAGIQYTLSESGPSGVTASVWNCTGGSLAEGDKLTLALGENVTCTITNTAQAATLIVNKVVVNNNGGLLTADDFSFNVNHGLSQKFNSTGQNVLTLDNGTYTVEEDPITGYQTTYDNCDNLEIANGKTKICTITNDDIAPSITLVKDVINNNGGTAQSDDFGLSIGGTFVDSNQKYLVESNTPYILNEIGLPGYSFVSLSGTGCPGKLGDTVTLKEGENIICTITNDDQAATLLVTKTVINDNGGNKIASDFTINVGGTNVSPISFSGAIGTTVTINAGSYSVDETEIGGYQKTLGENCSGIINNGETKSCTITNDDISPTLKLNKIVVNGIDGTKVAGDWTLTAQGEGGFSDLGGSTTFHAVKAGVTYDLGESGPSAYSSSWWSCDGGQASGNTVKLALDEDVACTITNTRDRGSLTVTKIIDQDGDLQTTEDQVRGENWQFDVDGTGIDTSDPSALSTGSSGIVTFQDIKTGKYTVIETKQSGYDLINATCGIENGIFDQIDSVDDVNVYKDVTTNCTFYNTPNGKVHGYKWEDVNSNQDLDQEESLLSGWTINLYRQNNDENYDLVNTMITSNTQPHFGWYWFEHLIPGNYKVCEEVKSGWTQTYPTDPNCHSMVLPDQNSSGFQESLNAIYGPEYNFGNKLSPPTATIAKFNDASGDLSPGSSVAYKIKLAIINNDVSGFKVVDLLSNGFKYRPGSYHISIGGTDVTGSIAEPQYHSPGVWNLGDLKAGDEVELTYIADINTDQQSGIYKDLAYAYGNAAYDSNYEILASSQIDGFVNENFVGTDVAVIKTSSNSVSAGVEKHKTSTGEVLGVSTELPATGAHLIWLIISSLMIFFAFTFFKKSSKKMFTLIFIVLFSFFTTQAKAISPLTLRIEQPKSPTNISDINLNYVALDINNNPIVISCYKKSPTDSTFTKFTTETLTAGGNASSCSLSSILTSEGTYQFYITATSTLTVTSPTLSLDYKNSSPGTPSDYRKDHPNSCEYKIHFKTADDAGRTTRIEIYRADLTSFIADNGSKVGDITIGSNQEYDFSNSVPDCSKYYYYVLRAFDAAGNGSGVIGDSVVITSSSSTTTVGTTTSVSGAIPVTGINLPSGTESSPSEELNTSNENGQVLGAENYNFTFLKKYWPLLAVFLLIIIGIIDYFLSRKKRKSDR